MAVIVFKVFLIKNIFNTSISKLFKKHQKQNNFQQKQNISKFYKTGFYVKNNRVLAYSRHG